MVSKSFLWDSVMWEWVRGGWNILYWRENTSDKVVSGFCSESDWLRKRHEVSGPITEHRKAKPKQSRISTNTLLKKIYRKKYLSLKVTPIFSRSFRTLMFKFYHVNVVEFNPGKNYIIANSLTQTGACADVLCLYHTPNHSQLEDGRTLHLHSRDSAGQDHSHT